MKRKTDALGFPVINRAAQRRAHAAERAAIISALGLAPEDGDRYVGTTAELAEDLARKVGARDC